MAKKVTRLDEIEARVNDMKASHPADIESNSFLRMPASLILDMDYLVKLARGRDVPAAGGEADAG